MKTKICTKCKKIKSILEFYKCKGNKDTYQGWCKKCMGKYGKKWEQGNKKERKEYNKKYAQDHKQELKQYSQKYRKKHKIKIVNYIKKYQQQHKEEIKKYTKEWYQKNKNKIIKLVKKYQQTHKKEHNENIRKKRQENPIFRITASIRARINIGLKSNTKSILTMSLIGCDFEFLAYHLQKQFKKGMNWDNYGYYGWHIDHIKPCVSFDLSKISEQRKCFHYTNLQPLWWQENLKKGIIPYKEFE